MAISKKENVEKRLIKIGLNKDQIALFTNFVNTKEQLEAIKIYTTLEITRERLDTLNECNLLLRVDKNSFDTSIEVLNDELFHYCTCPHRIEAKACSHAGAVLIYKLLKDEKNDFNTSIKKLLISQEGDKKNLSGIKYFKELFPKKIKQDKKNIIYFNFEDFDENSTLLKIQRGLIKNDGGYSMPMKFAGKNFNWNKLNLSKESRKLLTYVITEDTLGEGHASHTFSKNRFYDVNTDLMMPLFKELYFNEQELILGAVFSKDLFHISWEAIKDKDGDYILRPYFIAGKRKNNLSNLKLIDVGLNSLWVFDLKERCFYEHKEVANLAIVKSLIRFPKELILTEEELKEFFTKYYQNILDSFEFNVSEDFKREERSIIPKAKLYLEKSGKTAKINLRFDYAGVEVDYFSTSKDLVIVDGDLIYDVGRDFEEEDRIAELLNEYSVITHEKYDEFKLDVDLIDFVTQIIPLLTKHGVKILGEETLFNFKIVKSRPTMILDIRNNVDWFDIKGDVRFGKTKVEMEKVFEAIFKNKRFVDLEDGKKAVIPKEWTKELKGYRGFIGPNDKVDDTVSLSKYHLSALESLIHLSKKSNLDDSVKKSLEKFKGFDKIKQITVPKGINANLREYQKSGFDWLNFLRDYDFNGILADDMGLGKTLQALSLLQKIKEEKKKTISLVVVPTSLIFNWKNEILKFAPDLKYYIHHGLKRKKSPEQFENSLEDLDLIITTYGTLRNDLELFTSTSFEYIILDEAHVIKNPQSVTSKSVFSLIGKNKLVISGTPIQNNLTELWSLFNFLNKGYLGTFDSFKENFVIPIEREKDEDVTITLKKMIDPFLLKRNKKIISDELPPKTEIILRSEFNDDEKVIYENWKDYYMGEITRSIKEKGFGKSRLKILEGLTKLRQLCLHPKMIDPKYTGKSSKFDLLLMEVEKVLSEGHKVLIFSSYVKMLSIVREEFELKGIKYSYLDGKSRDREEIVNEFENSEDSRPFLISIKAGGVGLNLTSAAYVFIIDPWWNPAVEMQAMDRVHRIGQKNPVFVYKMISKDSIEEKILDLQKSKKKLVEEVISIEEGERKKIDLKTIKEIFK